MNSEKFEIRPMSRSELDVAIEWAAAEGWNPGLHDGHAFFAADPAGFYAGVLDGELIGSISVVRYPPDYAFLGFFIVKPQYRGRKYGLRLWLHAVESLGATLTGLDGVLAQTGSYARSGFENAYHNVRYGGLTAPAGAGDPNARPYAPADFDALQRYDRDCFPAPRHAFLQQWLQQPGATTLVYAEGGVLTGYGTIRPARDGYRIGPLFAASPAVARSLFDALGSHVPAGTPIYIDVPQPNDDAIALVTRHGMTPSFETARMYRGGSPKVDLHKVFGVTTLELG